MFIYDVQDEKSLFSRIQIDKNIITVFYRSGLSNFEKNLIPRTNRHDKQFVCTKQDQASHKSIMHSLSQSVHHHHIPYEKAVTIEDVIDLFEKFSDTAIAYLNTAPDKTRDIVYFIPPHELKTMYEKFKVHLASENGAGANDRLIENIKRRDTTTLFHFEQAKEASKSAGPNANAVEPACDVSAIRTSINELLGAKYIDKHVKTKGEKLWILDDSDPSNLKLTQSLLIPGDEKSKKWYETRLASIIEHVTFTEAQSNTGEPKYSITIRHIQQLSWKVRSRASAAAV